MVAGLTAASGRMMPDRRSAERAIMTASMRRSVSVMVF
jgi:hypothetical protein